MTDKSIMIAVRDGDTDKLRILFERYHIKLYNFFMRLTRVQQVSEDLVQEVFLKLLKYRRSYRGDGIFTTWFFQIAHNTFIDYMKKTKPSFSFEENHIDISDEDIFQKELDQKEAERFITEALYKLDETDREILTLSRYLNVKYKEIGKMLNMPEGTVKFRVHQALKRLKIVYHTITDEV